jgi:hypothetical protein
MIDKVSLAQKFGLFQDYWSPKIAGELNDSYVKLVKLKGEPALPQARVRLAPSRK